MSEPFVIEFIDKLEFLFQPARLKIAYGGRGGGKCLALGTKIIMYDGTLKKVEDIVIGDLLMGPDNRPRKVLGTASGQDIMFKVSQTSGIDYVVNSVHILSLKKSKSAISETRLQKNGNLRNPKGRYPSYKEITNINVVEASNKSERWKAHFRGYRAGLLHFAKQDVFIDPWYLGLWLGDGKSSDTIIYSADEEILIECQKLATKLQMNLVIYEQPNNKSVGIKIARLLGEYRNDLRDAFKIYNLFDNKHIPQDYISNSEVVRLELLAGLLDSDGYVHNNGYEITQTNKTLAYQIKYLADILGFRTNIGEKKTVCSNNGVTGLAYRLTINGDTWRIPCRLSRRQIKKENVSKNKDFLLSQIEIENIGVGEYAGFSLDKDGLFLLEDGTVTHNTDGYAIALIIMAMKTKLRILCLREMQNSIEESVKGTIESYISYYGLDDKFDIKDKSITCKRTGSRFIFSGLRYKINSIKSLAKIDIAWIEEANNTSKNSLDKLMPTIRGKHESSKDGLGGPFKMGPEVWISFNPELEDDEVYNRYVLNKELYAPDYLPSEVTGEMERYAYVVKINYSDNKWFPPDLKREMNLLKANNYVKYLEVWEGFTKQTLDGAVYSEEILKTLKDGRRKHVPYDPTKPVITAWDLGHSDKTAIWFIQRAGMEFNLINYYENRLKKLPHYFEVLQDLKYNYSVMYQPHDADNETLAARSISSMTRKAFPNAKVIVVQRPSKKVVGINAARTIFELCNFDEKLTADGWQCLSRYAYKVNEETGNFSREPDHDTAWSHGADAFQTFALSLRTETESKKKKIEPRVLPLQQQPRGWMGSI